MKAEIEGEHVLHVHEETEPERLVETESLAELRHVLGRGRARLAGEDLCGVAGCQVEQEEVERDDGEDHRHRLEQAPDDIAGRTADARQRHPRPFHLSR